MDLMDEELRRVLAGSAEPVRPESEFANEMRRLRARDAARPPSASEIQTASRPSFRMPSPGRRAPEQRGGGEAIDSIAAGFLSSIPAGIAGLATLPFAGPEKATNVIQRVQDALAIDPETEGGVRAVRGIAEAFSPLGVIPKAAGDATLRATGSPLLATGAELLADPLNLLGIGATAKPIARGAAAAGRGAAKAGKATVENLGPKAAEMAEAYMRRAGMTPEITVYHGSPHVFAPEEGAPLGRFRSEKIGSGEGAQAYGYGSYLAEEPSVATGYRERLTGSNPNVFRLGDKDVSIVGGSPEWKKFAEAAKGQGYSLESAALAYQTLKDKKGDLDAASGELTWMDNATKIHDDAASLLRDMQYKPEGGALYTVDLPDPIVDKMLDWDKPLSKQPAAVQEAISRIMQSDVLDADTKKLIGGKDIKASKFYEALASSDTFAGKGPFGAAASEYLMSQGIPGIKYLDEQSRAAGQGTRNFVVFPGEEKNLTILQRNEQRLPQTDTPAFKESDYETAQEGPFYRVNPRSAQADRPKTRGVREEVRQADDAAGSIGNDVPKPISDEAINLLIKDPSNFVRRVADEYSQRVTGQGYQMPDMPPSSLAKQSAIGRAFMAADEGSDAYKQAVFEAYGSRFPELVESAGAQNYDQLVEAAYRQLNKETLDQFRTLPVNMSFHRAGEGNYQSSGEMLRDIYGNRHLYVFQGGEPHPMMSGVDPATGLNDTEMFRAVHDFYGHGAHGNSFGQKGEEIAYGAHSQMYSPLARIAMATETRGQNSFVNFTPVNAQLKQRINRLNEARYEAGRRGQTADVAEIDKLLGEAWQGFRFGPQRSALLPPEMIGLEYSGGMPGYMRPLIRPEPGTTASEMLTHFSHSPSLQALDPTRYGTGIKGREMERLLGTQNPVMERSYAYTGDPSRVRPEPGLGRFRYGARSEGLYDLAADPLLFRTLAAEANRTPFTAKYNKGMTDPDQAFTDVERMAKEYGYEGLMNPQQGTAIMYRPTPVQPFQAGGAVKTKAQGGPVGGNMSYTQAADVIVDKLIRQGMDPDQAFMMALRMSDARMKAGGAVLMNEGGDPGAFQYTAEEDAAIDREKRRMVSEQKIVDSLQAAQERFEREQAGKTQESAANAAIGQANVARAMSGGASPMRKSWNGPMPDRPVVNGRKMVSAEELADFRRQFGASMTLRDLLNADQGRGPSAAMPAARGVQGANIKPAGPRVRPDETATLPSMSAADVPGLIMQGMQQGAQRVPAGRGAGAAFVGAGAPRAAMAAKTLRDHPSITPAQRQMLKEMDDYINALNKERVDPPGFAEGGKSSKAKPLVGIAPALRGAARTEARLAEKAAQEAAQKALAAAPPPSLTQAIEQANKTLLEGRSRPYAKPDTVRRMIIEEAVEIAKNAPKLKEGEVSSRAQRQVLQRLKWERETRPELQSQYGELAPSSYDMPAPRRMRNTPEVVAQRAENARAFLAKPTEPWAPPPQEKQAFERSLIKDALEGFPGIEQTRFPRYEAPRANVDYINEIYDDPKNRSLIKQQITRGLPLGGESFYGSLYPVKVAALERGIPAEKFDQFIYQTAPASARNSIMNEMAVGQFMRDMKARGLPLDEDTVTAEMAKFKEKYGTGLPLMPIHRQGVQNVIEGGLNMRDMVKADIPTNYKIPTYGTQKAGDFGKSVVLDVHEAAGETQGSRYHPYFTNQGGFGPAEYGLAESKMLDIANEMGIPGGMAQAGRWFGGGELTGLKSPRGDALDLLEKQAAYTLQGMGINPTPKVVRDYILNMIDTGEGVLMPWFKGSPMPDARTVKKEGGEVTKRQGALA